MIRIEYNERFIQELRDFAGEERKRVLHHTRSIERAPFALEPNRVQLPPMHRPGTVQANFDDVAIRYYVTRDDEAGTATVVFIRVFRRSSY